MKSSVSSPSTTACLHNDDVTLIHIKVDVDKDRIAFWPNRRKIPHGNQGGHTLEKCGSQFSGCFSKTSLNSHASVRATANANAFALV